MRGGLPLSAPGERKRRRGRHYGTANVATRARRLAAKETAKSLMKQVTAASRLPKLPKDQIKIIVRPKGGLDVSRADVVLLAQALAMAAALSEQQAKDDTVCPNKVQNILVISTPHDCNAIAYAKISKIHTKHGAYEVSAYIAAPEGTCKGVIRNIDPSHDDAALKRMIVNERNPTALEARRIKNSHVVVILFKGMRVPNNVICGMALVPCFLYKRQVDVCYACGHVGHRADVCTSSVEERSKCRGCGKTKPENEEEEHHCTPQCEACGGSHVTGDRTCKKRYQIPYIVRRRRRRRRRRKAQLDVTDVTDTSDSSAAAPAARSGSILRIRSESRGRSRSRGRSKPRKGESSDASRSRSRSRSQSAKQTMWADKVKGVTQPSQKGQKNTSNKGTKGEAART